MRIIQISDSHIDLNTTGRIADLENCIAAVNAEKPDIVIHTGDISHNNLETEYRAARNVLDTLDAPYYVLAGNKDTRSALHHTFHDHEYLSQNDDFIQYSIDLQNTRLIMLDTVTEGTSKGELCERRLSDLKKMLEHTGDTPIVIFMHHAPYVVEEIPDPRQFHNWGHVDALEKLLSANRCIQQIYCGHVHRNVAGTIGELQVEVLTCIATDLRKGKLSDLEIARPEFRVIEIP